MEKRLRLIFKKPGNDAKKPGKGARKPGKGAEKPAKDALDALRSVCMNQNWLLRAKRDGNVEEQIAFELVYMPADGSVTVVYVDDPIAKCTYAHVTGDRMDAAAEIIRRKIPTWSDDELFQDWENAKDVFDQFLAILRIGVGSPSAHDERFRRRLDEGLARDDPAVREAALAAVGYTGWPEFDDALKNIAQNDAAERCRARAAFMLDFRARERAGSPR